MYPWRRNSSAMPSIVRVASGRSSREAARAAAAVGGVGRLIGSHGAGCYTVTLRARAMATSTDSACV